MMKELPEYVNAKEIKIGRTGVIVDKVWNKDINDYLYTLEYDEKKDTDICGCLSESLTADELELV